MSPPSFGAAARILAERDPVIARLVAEAGPPRLSRPTRPVAPATAILVMSISSFTDMTDRSTLM